MKTFHEFLTEYSSTYNGSLSHLDTYHPKVRDWLRKTYEHITELEASLDALTHGNNALHEALDAKPPEIETSALADILFVKWLVIKINDFADDCGREGGSLAELRRQFFQEQQVYLKFSALVEVK